MPTDILDWYDVNAMVQTAQNAERAARQRHIDDVTRDLRAEFRREVMELREEMGGLIADVLKAVATENVTRREEIAALRRTFDARTEAGV